MLFEIYQYLTTPCPRPLKRMGYLGELIGMAARYRRCRAAWQPHLQHSQDWIIEAMAGRSGRVVVLGSGLLYDVPLKALSDHFDDVVLVDILHMPQVTKAIRPYANVRLETRDVTGFIEPLYEHVRHGTALAEPATGDIVSDGADLVISLNILSQLAILPARYGDLEAATIEGLMQGHLDALEQSAGTVCLISEVEHRRSLKGQLVEKQDPLTGVKIPSSLKTRRASWDWNFAPHPERHRHQDLVYRVEGYLR